MTNLRSEGIVLGVFADIDLEDKTVHLAPGDFVIFFTDGVTEAMNQLAEFGLDKLREIISRQGNHSAKQMLWAIVDAVNALPPTRRNQTTLL
jgi:phosphoserine phosphatase RsbU/P